MGKLILILSILFYSTAGSLAQSSDSVRPSVSVVGEAEMSISPNQVVFTFEVITADKEVATAKKANDIAAAKTLTAAKGFNINDEDVQTACLTISPKYTGEKDPRGARVLLGYEVTKRIVITLKDLNKIDSFLAKVIEAGVNRVVEISIENSQMQKYQEEARTAAIKNAQTKALAYAKQLGQTIGKAYVIREEDADYPSYNQSLGSGNGSGRGDGDYGDPESPSLALPNVYGREITFALGKIKVEEKIYVIFELNK